MLGLYDPVPAKTNEKSFWLLKNFLESLDLNCSAHESPWIMTFDCPSPTSSNIKDVGFCASASFNLPGDVNL